MMRWITLLCFLLLPAAATAAAAPADRGHAILKQKCSRCHAIDKTGDSPLPAAPPFRDVIKRYPPEALTEALGEGLVTGHADMPEFVFPAEDVGAIVGYLHTLAEPGAAASQPPQPAADPAIAAGHALAEQNCASCHSIAGKGNSPLAEAPPFRDMARDYDMDDLEDALNEGVASEHPVMPDWQMTTDQAHDLAAFVMSLTAPAAPAADTKTDLGGAAPGG